MAALTVYSDAYLFVIYQVDGQPGVQYMTTDYVDGPTHATLVTTGFEKMHVTAGTYTLYLYDNQDGTLELSTEPMAGKTLVSTLPAYLNALEGKGVHIVTVNDYLAKRDSEWMGKIYKFLGLSVGVILSNQHDADEFNRKRAAYAALFCIKNPG